jgi:hypothetical protein
VAERIISQGEVEIDLGKQEITKPYTYQQTKACEKDQKTGRK